MAVVPKFIQSSYYELFLAELFPYESRAVASTDQGDEEKDSDSRGGALTASLEAIRHDPEAVAKRIAEAVAAARAAAEAEAVAAAEAAAALEAQAEKVEGDMQQQLADSEVRFAFAPLFYFSFSGVFRQHSSCGVCSTQHYPLLVADIAT